MQNAEFPAESAPDALPLSHRRVARDDRVPRNVLDCANLKERRVYPRCFSASKPPNWFKPAIRLIYVTYRTKRVLALSKGVSKRSGS
jgi:hypothetical protein